MIASGEGFAREQQREQVHLHNLLPTKKFQQDFDPLPGGQHLHHGCAHAAERSVTVRKGTDGRFAIPDPVA